jgi:hypothetical protein
VRKIFTHNFATGSRRLFGSVMVLLLVVSTALPFTSNTPKSSASEHATSADDPACLFGGVEIGASGVKAVAIRVNNVDEGYSAKQIYEPETANTNIMEGVATTRRLRKERIDETAKAVNDFYRKILELGVPSDHLYVVGSSGVRADNLSDLSDKVKELTGAQMAFLTVDEEVNFAISGAVPKYTRVYVRNRKTGKRRMKRIDNRGRSVFIDIGSGNTKGGYQERTSVNNPPDYRVVSFGIPFGTKTLAQKASDHLPKDSEGLEFSHAAKSAYTDVFTEPLRSALETRPGLQNRPKVYLSGGIVWTMATLLHPEDRRPYVSLTAADIDRFYEEVVRDPDKLLNPDLSRLDPAIREAAEDDVNRAQTTFSKKQLIAGAQILKALSRDLNFANPRRDIRFVRAGYIAWILRYVNLKSIEDNTDCH